MSLQQRLQILNQLGSELGAPVLSLATGDRPGLQTQLSAEQLVQFPRHLDAIGRHDHLALLLYTRGGDTNFPWPMVSFLRELCDRLTILVPFYAHSAGTLLALGADEIVMTRYATLSPIDPTVVNQFNPQDPANTASRLPIAVEDVLAFFELAEKHRASTDAGEFAFRRLAESVHPLALGNVQRSINQIRELALKMLRLRADPPADKEAQHLVSHLTTEMYSHMHMVSRREAGKIGLPIIVPTNAVEALLFAYYGELTTDLELLDKFDPPAILRRALATAAPVAAPVAAAPSGTAVPGPISPAPGSPLGPQPASIPTPPPQSVAIQVAVRVERAYIETSGTSDAFVTEGTISQQQVAIQMGSAGVQMLPNQQQMVTFEVLSEKWERMA